MLSVGSPEQVGKLRLAHRLGGGGAENVHRNRIELGAEIPRRSRILSVEADAKVRCLHARHKLAGEAPAPMVNGAATQQIGTSSQSVTSCDPGV